MCGTCHDVNEGHEDPALQQSVLSTSGDCFTCHPHSSGFMPVSGAVSLSLSKTVVGYDDLDVDGTLSPGDRVHYRVDYSNPGPEDITGAVLSDTPDTAYVAGVESITGGGVFDGAGIQWAIGTVAAEASGFVTYDVVLQDAAAFDGGGTTTTDTSTHDDRCVDHDRDRYLYDDRQHHDDHGYQPARLRPGPSRWSTRRCSRQTNGPPCRRRPPYPS